MNDQLDLSLEQQQAWIDRLSRAITERSAAETSLQNSRAAREAATAVADQTERDRLLTLFAREKQQLQSDHTRELAAIVQQYELQVEQAETDHATLVRDTTEATESACQSLQTLCAQRRQAVKERCEGQLRDAQAKLQKVQAELDPQFVELEQLEQQAIRVARRRLCYGTLRKLPELAGVASSDPPGERYANQAAAARECLHALPRQWSARLTTLIALTCTFSVSLVVALITGMALDNSVRSLIDFPTWVQSSTGLIWTVTSSGVSLGVAALLFVILRPIVVHRTIEMVRQCQQHLANASVALEISRKLAIAEADRKRILLQQTLEQEQRLLGAQRNQAIAERLASRDAQLQTSANRLQEQTATWTRQRDEQQLSCNRQFEQRRLELESTIQTRTQAWTDRQALEQAANQEAFARGWQRLEQRWHEQLRDLTATAHAMLAQTFLHAPAWDAIDWSTWQPPDQPCQELRFGTYQVSLSMFEAGLPESPELRPEQTIFTLPAVVSFHSRPALLLEAYGDGRRAANVVLLNHMLRLLTALPAGKTRFTIIDPIGRGQDFSAFMHLADFDEKLVHHRIWTESPHIQQRLADLTEQMEDVIQTYLRNEFETIEQYNRHAGEVAEPYHILVVANFPAGFSEEAAARLRSIVEGGARCGVYACIGVDTRQELPRNFTLADLEPHATTLEWSGSRFCWFDSDLKDLPLTLDQPPANPQITELVRAAGRLAQAASRVEVPFATVAPRPEAWWTSDSRAGLDVPLGRAGATQLQSLRLGRGTSQHVLISGKTGSGKSTLLHALITNTALRYSPDEVQFYLIDFKKGVEFKPYATLQLPHAQVIAIESEREFGLSVLARLDAELTVRGEQFRNAGVQDIAAFREVKPSESMPRLLLIIDEFQEFFVVDDKLAQEAALLLDRLVRQGRAFGMHVLLGSQTLSGAYSLARSTIGQMAVRIALQCSEADAHLILSEQNTAARLLSRPGEAIYNDANGQFEGNHPFQIVWLASSEQESYLRALSERAAALPRLAMSPIVFEGNAPADMRLNRPLDAALRHPLVNVTTAPIAWLGAPVAIKEPTAVTFRRQAGSHLLIVGQQEEAAQSLLLAAMLSLAATSAPRASRLTQPSSSSAPSQEPSDARFSIADSLIEITDAQLIHSTLSKASSPSTRPRFDLFDGSLPESPSGALWKHWFPPGDPLVRRLEPEELIPALNELSQELERRLGRPTESSPARFVVFFGLGRFRDLRRRETEFSFTRLDDDATSAPDQQFLRLLREGPAVGIHLLIWCDNYMNWSRLGDRTALRECEHRVLFQMSTNDSANLMDSPAASRLGQHRALLYTEEQGQAEKFRPYGNPDPAWLTWAWKQLNEEGRPGT